MVLAPTVMPLHPVSTGQMNGFHSNRLKTLLCPVARKRVANPTVTGGWTICLRRRICEERPLPATLDWLLDWLRRVRPSRYFPTDGQLVTDLVEANQQGRLSPGMVPGNASPRWSIPREMCQRSELPGKKPGIGGGLRADKPDEVLALLT